MERANLDARARRDLIAGRDYPRAYREFVNWCHDDEACAVYPEKFALANRIQVPSMRVAADPWRQTRGRLVCSSCRHRTSVTAGTILDKTGTPLTTWFEAAWHVTTAKNGLSAKTLERTLGTRYRPAWSMRQRFRVAMVRAEREHLSGDVEVDEALLGGVERGGKPGRGTDKCIVAIADEVKQPRGFGRVRMRHIPDASDVGLRPFIRDLAAPGSTIRADGWSGYSRLSRCGHTHKKTIVSSSGDPAHVAMPGVHRIAGLLKRWILGTHQGSVSDAHLESYLEEFTFRFNRRTSRSRALVFRRLLEQVVATGHATDA